MPPHEDGDQETASNYRGIALGSCVAKVLTKPLSRRLSTFAEEEILTEAQGGFRYERRRADQILILRWRGGGAEEERKEGDILFLDVSKAYDTVWRVEKSVHISVEGCAKELRQAWCWMGDSQDGFQLKKDCQGCPLSPFLYSIYLWHGDD